MFNAQQFAQAVPLTPATLFYALGYGVGVGAFAWIAHRRRLATTGIWTLVYIALLGGLVGANVGQMIFGNGAPGKSILGGVVGGWLSILVAKRAMGITRPIGDLFAFGLAAGEAVGRWGCFAGGCCFGKPAPDLLWHVHQHDTFRHPTQAYLSIAALGVFALLLALELRHALPENGLFFLQGALFAGSRFGIEFFRDAPPTFTTLTTAQLVSLPLFLLFTLLFVRVLRSRATSSPDRTGDKEAFSTHEPARIPATVA